ARRLERFGGASNREVVGLGAAAREDDLRWVAANERSQIRAGFVERGFGLLAEVVDARRGTEDLTRDPRAGIRRVVLTRRHRVLVKIDTHWEYSLYHSR